MKLGISSYTYMWSIGFPGAEPANPLSALGLLDRAVELGVRVVQFGPNLPVAKLPENELQRVVAHMHEHKLQIELATRTLDLEHLRSQLRLARTLECVILRSVPESHSGDVLSLSSVEQSLRGIIPELEERPVRLTLENGRIPARLLAELLDRLNCDRIGITLDTVNSLAIPEGIEEVVQTLAPYTCNLHIKDFIVRREWHTMGFVVEGRPAGEGQLNVPRLLQVLSSAGARFNAILELWPPQQRTLCETVALEQQWARDSVRYLRTLITE
jgi:3-oxoisoapionate decarboxylase